MSKGWTSFSANDSVQGSLKLLAEYGMHENDAVPLLLELLNKNAQYSKPQYIQQQLANIEQLGFSKAEIGQNLARDSRFINFQVAKKRMREKKAAEDAKGKKKKTRKAKKSQPQSASCPAGPGIVKAKPAPEPKPRYRDQLDEALRDYGTSSANLPVLRARKLDINCILRRLINLEKQGFSKSQIGSMLEDFPGLAVIPSRELNSRLATLMAATSFNDTTHGCVPMGRRGFIRFAGPTIVLSQEEAREIVLVSPAVLRSDERELRWKLRVMAIVTGGDKEEMMKRAKEFEISHKTLARRASLLRKRTSDWRNHSDLFLPEKAFQRKYKMRF